MQIKINSNRSFIVKAFVPLVIIAFIVIVLISISLFVNYNEQKDSILILIVLVVYTVVMIGVILLVRFYKGKRYEFTENEIVCYKKEKKIRTINVSDILGISFYRWKLQYIFTIFTGVLNDGGCWKLHVKLKDGTKIELAFFSKKDAMLLQKKLYGDLLTIS